MCLVVLGINLTPELPLVVAANRDEFHSRPTRNLHWWSDHPDIVGGRDLQAGGTWLAAHRNGRIATVTNSRDAVPPNPKNRSRGHLVTEFLLSDLAPLDYLRTIDGEQYSGFNLLVGDKHSVAYLSNRDTEPRTLEDGVYAVSNAILDTPWHKVEYSKAALSELVDTGRLNETELMRLLHNTERAPASQVEAGSLGFEFTHGLTATFIVQREYGTRCSTVLMRNPEGELKITERSFNAEGKSQGDRRFNVSQSQVKTPAASGTET